MPTGSNWPIENMNLDKKPENEEISKKLLKKPPILSLPTAYKYRG